VSSIPPVGSGSIPPVGNDGPVEYRETIVRDRTPEREEVERTITPVGTSKFGGNKTGAIVGVAAVVAALFFINVGGSNKEATTNSMTLSDQAKNRPDERAAQTAAYDPGQVPPNLAGGPPAPPAAVTLADGTVVPAIQPGAAPTGAPVGGGARPSGESLADKTRRASMLVSIGGQDGGQGVAAQAPAGYAGQAEAPGQAAAPLGELDKLRQVSAIGTSRASMLSNRNYLITAGTLIPCVLQTAMNSSQPGYTSCVVPRDVFSDNGRVVLLEKGTKVLGQYQGGLSQGQNRLFVLWTRATTPRGVAIDLASPASDALGRAGMAGGVDTFFWARFGGAIMLTLIDAAGQAASSAVASGGSYNVSQPSTAASTSLQQTQNIRPVLKKNQGEEVGIFVAQDFNFSDVYNVGVRP